MKAIKSYLKIYGSSLRGGSSLFVGSFFSGSSSLPLLRVFGNDTVDDSPFFLCQALLDLDSLLLDPFSFLGGLSFLVSFFLGRFLLAYMTFERGDP